MSKFQEIVRSVITSKETELGEGNHDGDGPDRKSRLNQAIKSMVQSRLVNNCGAGSQFNNESGNQNVFNGDVSILGSTFNGKVQFLFGKEEFSGKALLRHLCCRF